jgi:hypothetical protein
VSKKRYWLLVAVAVSLAAAAGIWVRRGGHQPALATGRTATDSLLNIPLERTVLAREEFVQAYRKTDRVHAVALYEQFLPRIGANGLQAGIATVYPGCHDEAHDLGKVIFSKLRDVGASLESCADACGSGCMHGVLMQFFTDGQTSDSSHHQHSAQLTAADVAARIPTFCESQALTRRYSPGDCAHGVGHAVMFLSKYDISAGIDLCERFPSYALQYYCATGAYMEYRFVRIPKEYPIHGGFYPCDTVRYPAACFRNVMATVIRWHYAKGGTFKALQEQCATLSRKYRLGCFHGIGQALVGRVARGQMTLAQLCEFGSRDDQTMCVEGGMERLGKFEPAVALERCGSLTDWLRQTCQAAVSRKMYDMNKSFAMYQR